MTASAAVPVCHLVDGQVDCRPNLVDDPIFMAGRWVSAVFPPCLLESGTLADRHWWLIDSNQGSILARFYTYIWSGWTLHPVRTALQARVGVCVPCRWFIHESAALPTDGPFSTELFDRVRPRVLGPTAFDYFMSSEKCLFERRVDDSFFFIFSLFFLRRHGYVPHYFFLFHFFPLLAFSGWLIDVWSCNPGLSLIQTPPKSSN